MVADIGPDGFGLKRRDWNDVDFGNKDGATSHHRARAVKDGFLNSRCKSWAEYVNAALADAGSSNRIDHRSLEEQGSRCYQRDDGKSRACRRQLRLRSKEEGEGGETTDYNADLVSNLYPLIVSTVVDFLEGGPIGAVEAGIAGLLPGADQVLGSIPRAVVGASMVDFSSRATRARHSGRSETAYLPHRSE